MILKPATSTNFKQTISHNYKYRKWKFLYNFNTIWKFTEFIRVQSTSIRSVLRIQQNKHSTRGGKLQNLTKTCISAALQLNSTDPKKNSHLEQSSILDAICRL